MAVVTISPPTRADGGEFLAAVTRSCELHGNWVSPPRTQDAFEGYLTKLAAADRHGFLVRKRDDGALTGIVNISNIVGEPLLSACLGFYAFEPFARRGYLRAGLRLVIEYAFGELHLHRLEANIQPANAASIALARSCGFQKEGFSPRYLRIAGEWRDHERWAVLADDWRSVGGKAGD